MTEATDRQRVETIRVSPADDGLRLDRWFRTHFPALGHGPLERMLRKGQIRVDGVRAKASVRLATGQDVRVPPDVPRAESAAPGKPATNRPGISRKDAEATIAAWTLYEDDAILAVNKPFGIAVQGGTGTTRHVDAYLAALERNGERLRLVHRLDRDTGGLLLLAKTRLAAAEIGHALQQKAIEKTYWALVVSGPRPREGRIDMPLGKGVPQNEEDGPERALAGEREGAKKAITDYQTIEQAGHGPAFIAMRPITGRTHQLRAHAAVIGTPIVGDGKYGGAEARVDGVARKLHLFCRSMRFRHPSTGRDMTLVAPLSGHMLETWRFFDFPTDVKVAWPDEATAAGRRSR